MAPELDTSYPVVEPSDEEYEAILGALQGKSAPMPQVAKMDVQSVRSDVDPDLAKFIKEKYLGVKPIDVPNIESDQGEIPADILTVAGGQQRPQLPPPDLREARSADAKERLSMALGRNLAGASALYRGEKFDASPYLHAEAQGGKRNEEAALKDYALAKQAQDDQVKSQADDPNSPQGMLARTLMYRAGFPEEMVKNMTGRQLDAAMKLFDIDSKSNVQNAKNALAASIAEHKGDVAQAVAAISATGRFNSDSLRAALKMLELDHRDQWEREKAAGADESRGVRKDELQVRKDKIFGDRMVKLGNDLDKGGGNVGAQLQTLKALDDLVTTGKGDIPGVGLVEGGLPSVLTSDKGNAIRQLAMQLYNPYIKEYAGIAVNAAEKERMNQALGVISTARDEKQFLGGVDALKRTLHEAMRRVYGQNNTPGDNGAVVRQFIENTGYEIPGDPVYSKSGSLFGHPQQQAQPAPSQPRSPQKTRVDIKIGDDVGGRKVVDRQVSPSRPGKVRLVFDDGSVMELP